MSSESHYDENGQYNPNRTQGEGPATAPAPATNQIKVQEAMANAMDAMLTYLEMTGWKLIELPAPAAPLAPAPSLDGSMGATTDRIDAKPFTDVEAARAFVGMDSRPTPTRIAKVSDIESRDHKFSCPSLRLVPSGDPCTCPSKDRDGDSVGSQGSPIEAGAE